jgi:hypothetical protein
MKSRQHGTLVFSGRCDDVLYTARQPLHSVHEELVNGRKLNPFVENYLEEPS